MTARQYLLLSREQNAAEKPPSRPIDSIFGFRKPRLNILLIHQKIETNQLTSRQVEEDLFEFDILISLPIFGNHYETQSANAHCCRKNVLSETVSNSFSLLCGDPGEPVHR